MPMPSITSAPFSMNERRTPAHLSVSLRHDDPAVDGFRRNLNSVSEGSSSARALSRRGNAHATANEWFERSNKDSAMGFNDSDPPYFLRRADSSLSDSAPSALGKCVRGESALFPNGSRQHGADDSSGGDDFRSVIDDLTIENKRLRDRLRKYEASYSTHLDKEKLFEVKIHGLPPGTKRKLEETLRSFASSVDGLHMESKKHKSTMKTRDSNASSDSRNASSSSVNSRPGDSAYASMSEPRASSFTSTGNNDQQRGAVLFKTKHQKIESYLHDIPEGLLPKRLPVMTEKEKKKIVVRRLEQLFTGKRSSSKALHSQPMQQQEISTSAARADRKAIEEYGMTVIAEGIREASILPSNTDINLATKTSALEGPEEDNTAEGDDEHETREQRPTRPLDLDPDRAQVPTDNIEYIRHLGLSMPQLALQDTIAPLEASQDVDGWVYLNLLVSMAQLHMINVTPAFVRSAVSEVSDKFQVSRDGRKLRWRGGTEGTKLSSDSGGDSNVRSSPNDSDSFDESNVRHRTAASKWKDHDNGREHGRSRGQYNLQPVDTTRQDKCAAKANPYHYKPLFKHCSSSTEEGTSVNGAGSSVTFAPANLSHVAKLSSDRKPFGSAWSSMSGRRAVDEGTMVFYSGVPFCIDLSADRRDISTPSHVRGVGKDGYSNHTHDALGCKPSDSHQPALCRTESGSFLNVRPFKDYSKVAEAALLPQSERRKTPEPLTELDGDSEFDFAISWAGDGDPPISPQLPDMKASGLGAMQPADHFVVRVETHHSKLNGKAGARLSKFSAPSPKRRRFTHIVSPAALASFHEPTRSAERIASQLASRRTDLPPVPAASAPNPTFTELPVKSKVVSVSTRSYAPSVVPPPTSFFVPSSGSEDCSEGTPDVDSADIELLRTRRPFERSAGNTSHEETSGQEDDVEMDSNQDTEAADIMDLGTENDCDDDDDDDESIDMLAAARMIDPEAVAAQEAEFEAEARRRIDDELPLGGSAATIDRASFGSGYSSVAGSELSDSDMSEDD